MSGKKAEAGKAASSGVKSLADAGAKKERKDVEALFVEQVKHKSAIDLVRNLKAFISENETVQDIRDTEEKVQNLLRTMEREMRTREVWKSCTDEEFQDSMDGLERYVTCRNYKAYFQPGKDDVQRDKDLTEEIAALASFIEPKHLRIPEVSDSAFDQAIKDLRMIEWHKSPREKMKTLLRCARSVREVLKAVSADAKKDADLPRQMLIYVVLRTNPPQFLSHLEFIKRFRRREKLHGDAGMVLANMFAAVKAIQALNGSKLSMSEREFDEKKRRALGRHASKPGRAADAKVDFQLLRPVDVRPPAPVPFLADAFPAFPKTPPASPARSAAVTPAAAWQKLEAASKAAEEAASKAAAAAKAAAVAATALAAVLSGGTVSEVAWADASRVKTVAEAAVQRASASAVATAESLKTVKGVLVSPTVSQVTAAAATTTAEAAAGVRVEDMITFSVLHSGRVHTFKLLKTDNVDKLFSTISEGVAGLKVDREVKSLKLTNCMNGSSFNVFRSKSSDPAKPTTIKDKALPANAVFQVFTSMS